MIVDQWNQMNTPQAEKVALGWCGSQRFAEIMVGKRPNAHVEQIHQSADATFELFEVEDWLEAFAAHPRLGDLNSLRMKFAGNEKWSVKEQSGIELADESTLESLAEMNDRYFEKFGFIFILKATGKSAAEMFKAIEQRFDNDRDTEIKNAGDNQRLITHLRIDKEFA